MTDKLSERIRSLEDAALPEGLHGRIVRRLLFLQFRKPFLVVLGLLAVNLVVSGWHIYARFSEDGTLASTASGLIGFGWDRAYFREAASVLFDLFPVSLLLTFIVNLALVGYLASVVINFRRLPRERRGAEA